MKPVMDWFKEISKSSGGQLTCADHGDCICLKPKSINKGSGIKWLMSLYGNAGLRINFERSLWIGDGKSDIPAAQYIHKKGGKVAAVANSHPEYLKLIEKLNGYVSKNQQTAGMVEILKNVRV
jgi:hydroxymethylpyrimidine pyrophosphatase-like HAD family hydrolase